MAHVFFDRVADTTTTTGTGDVTVSGTPPTGFKTIDDRLSASDTGFFLIAHQTLDEWEVVLGTYSGSHVLARTELLDSSTGSAVDFSAGTKDVVLVMPAALFSGGLRLRDTNASHDLRIAPGSNLTALRTLTLATGDADRTLTLNADTTLAGPASDTAAGPIEIAVQSEMEAATDVALAVTPGRQHFHPSAAKWWCICGVTGNILASYNTTSVTDGGTGIVTFNIATDFSGANWAGFFNHLSNAFHGWTRAHSIAAGTLELRTVDTSSTVQDPTSWHAGGFGDHA